MFARAGQPTSLSFGHCMWERGQRRNDTVCSALAPLSVTSPLPTSKLGPSGADSLCAFSDPVGLSNKLSCEAGSFSHHHTPHRFSQPEVLRHYFPTLEPTLGCVVCPTPHLFFLIYPHVNVGLPGPLPCCASSPPWLPISAPPTSLDECFFFNSLVAGSPV